MKSYKREIAFGSLVWLFVIATYSIYIGDNLTRVSILSTFVLPTFALVGAAFSLDSYFKYDYAKNQSILDYKAEQDRLNYESESDADVNRIVKNDFDRDDEDFTDMVTRRNRLKRKAKDIKNKAGSNEA